MEVPPYLSDLVGKSRLLDAASSGIKDEDIDQVDAKRDAVLGVLEARGIQIDDVTKLRIQACADPEQLKRWIRQAAVVGRAAELFAEVTSGPAQVQHRSEQVILTDSPGADA